jgi:hypothetical protein
VANFALTIACLSPVLGGPLRKEKDPRYVRQGRVLDVYRPDPDEDRQMAAAFGNEDSEEEDGHGS